MSRIAQTLPITPKMYRHFAVITIVLTASLALFADGEQQQMIRDELARQQSPSGQKAKEEDKRLVAARAHNARANRRSNRAMAGEEAGFDASDGTFDPEADFSAPVQQARPGPSAMSPWASNDGGAGAFGPQSGNSDLSLEMQRKAKKRKQDEPPPRPNQKQLDAMLEMSAARSGAASGDISD